MKNKLRNKSKDYVSNFKQIEKFIKKEIAEIEILKNSSKSIIPEILDISASVMWDGEQTLGGNWISHPNVDSPERVLIKNISNGKSIVGAIFQQTKKKISQLMKFLMRFSRILL